MSEKRPQPTAMLIERLRRVAKFLDSQADVDARSHPLDTLPQWRARANTCWQAAARLQKLLDQPASVAAVREGVDQPVVSTRVKRKTDP